MWQFHDPPMLLLVFRNLRLVEDLNQTEHGADLALKWQFTGLSDEDSTVQIQNFLEISDTCTPTRVNKDYVMLTLFPFSLLGEAKRWLNSEPANSITT